VIEHPENIKNNFFVTGKKVSNLSLALSTELETLKSYVDEVTCMRSGPKLADDWIRKL
jgi:hypothetical protein